jgi:hypothetical protein
MSRRSDGHPALIAKSLCGRDDNAGEHDGLGAGLHSCRQEPPLAIPVVFTRVDTLATDGLV